MRRIKAALKTNEPQMTSVIALSMFNVLVAWDSGDAAIVVVAALVWPCVAFTYNLIDPIP